MLRAVQAAGTIRFHQLAGQDPAWAKAQWLGVSARLGREEGQSPISENLQCLAAGFGFVQQAAGSRGLLLSTEVIAPRGACGRSPRPVLHRRSTGPRVRAVGSA